MPDQAISHPVELISATHRRAFQEDGFFVLERVIPENLLALARRECDEAVARTEERMVRDGKSQEGLDRHKGRYFIAFPSQDNLRLDPFVYDETMADICRATIGEDAFLFYDQFVVKGTEQGTAFAWHQDSGYVGHPHRPYLTLWCPLDDVDERNGTIHVLSFSQAGGREVRPHHHDEAEGSLVGYRGEDPGQMIIAKAGSIVVFSSLTLHRSGPNRTSAYRRAYVVQYSPEVILDRTGTRPDARAVPFLSRGRNLRPQNALLPAQA